MNKHYVASLIDPSILTCGVKFKGGDQVYTYKHRLDLKVGDEVIVQTPKNGAQVVEVMRVDDVPDLEPETTIDYAWVIQKLDRTTYDAAVEQDKELFKRVKDFERQRHRQQAIAALNLTTPGLLQSVAVQATAGHSSVLDVHTTPVSGPQVAPRYNTDAENKAFEEGRVAKASYEATPAEERKTMSLECPYSRTAQPFEASAWNAGWDVGTGAQ